MQAKINVYIDDGVNPEFGTFGPYKDKPAALKALLANNWEPFWGTAPEPLGCSKNVEDHDLVAYIVDYPDDMQPPKELP